MIRLFERQSMRAKSFMSAGADEWLKKAASDFRVAEYEFARPDDPEYDAVCYHCQQCVEKLMKAVLVKNGQTPPFTHDLIALSRLLVSVTPKWTCDTNDLRFLSLAAVYYRYPGDTADRRHAERALSFCKILRTKLLAILEE